jgi:hypothetical protein
LAGFGIAIGIGIDPGSSAEGSKAIFDPEGDPDSDGKGWSPFGIATGYRSRIEG